MVSDSSPWVSLVKPATAVNMIAASLLGPCDNQFSWRVQVTINPFWGALGLTPRSQTRNGTNQVESGIPLEDQTASNTRELSGPAQFLKRIPGE